MRVHFLTPAIIFSLLLGCEFALADLYREAVQAETEGIPEVSVTKLRLFLAGNPSGTEIKTAKLLLAKCLLQIRRPEEALTVLNDSSLSSAEARQLKAETLLRTRHWDDAAGLFKEILTDAGSDANARLGLAEAQLRKGESDQALATLQPLLENRANPDSRAILMTAEIELSRANLDQAAKLLTRLSGENDTEQLQKQCLLGQIAFQAGKLDEAEAAFNRVISASKGLTARLLALAQLSLARVSIQQQEFDEAESVMVKAITDQSRSVMLPELFETLYSIYALEQSPTLTPLIHWSQEDPQEVGADRPAFALYYLGKLQLRLDAKAKGEATLRRLINDYPTHRLAGLATVAIARFKIDQDAADQALPLLTQWLANESNQRTTERVQIEETLADAYFREAKFREAQEIYFQLAGTDPPNGSRFLYGAAICGLRSGDRQHYETAVRELNGSPDNQTLLGNLEIARAIIEAKSGQTGADTTLKHFLASFPDHPQTPEAHLLLAEIAFTELPPNHTTAKNELEQISAGSPETAESKARLNFFVLADDPQQNTAAVARAAQDFIQQYPESAVRAEVRLKLGEVYFRQNDFPNAQTQFELVAEQQPDSPLVETALFLAGEAARKSLNPSSVDRAVDLFEEVYKMDGPLRFQARLEQALTKRQIQQEKEAIVLLDDLLAQNIPPEIRCEALEAKGESQFSLGAKDKSQYEAALKTFDSLAAAETNSPDWRQSALYRKAKCFQQLGKTDEALSALYDVLSAGGNKSDEFWFFRAGFDAAELLEARRAWASAAAVYEKLTAIPSPRSEEAKNRLERLRLEHFLWAD
ncbi:MAG TPA: tetratricopeptide repeat protein [Chthoniobacterales bacterium]|nr:tetratricopeptide repeat protein [Chthoniobacterales bacterium]